MVKGIHWFSSSRMFAMVIDSINVGVFLVYLLVLPLRKVRYRKVGFTESCSIELNISVKRGKSLQEKDSHSGKKILIYQIFYTDY